MHAQALQRLPVPLDSSLLFAGKRLGRARGRVRALLPRHRARADTEKLCQSSALNRQAAGRVAPPPQPIGFTAVPVQRPMMWIPAANNGRGRIRRSARSDRPLLGWHVFVRARSVKGGYRSLRVASQCDVRSANTNPDVMGGLPCIKGLRFPVATVIAMVADGMAVEEILSEHPGLTREDVRESLLYAAEAVRERELPLRHSA